MSGFEKCKKKLLSKGQFYSLLNDRKTKGEEHEHVVNVWKYKKYEGLPRLVLKTCCFVIN